MIDTKLYELINEAQQRVLSTGRNITIVVNHKGQYAYHIDITANGVDDQYADVHSKLKKVTSYQIKYATNKDIIYIELT